MFNNACVIVLYDKGDEKRPDDQERSPQTYVEDEMVCTHNYRPFLL